ncbi:hypothetical protein QQZ08_010596 [Neonectria magnoliae]|uniref:Uncharacterized protein n=1 Tax=Neonectria magnoliae TaxID=2732573 RepID=A0ABR1HGC7_9HYPO
MSEASAAFCKFNGVLYTDDRFMDLLDTKVRDVRTHEEFESQKDKYFREFAQEVWHRRMKLEFGGDISEWTFNVPGHWLAANPRSRRRQYPKLKFTSAELEFVFEPVLDIGKLIQDQINMVLNKTSEVPKGDTVSDQGSRPLRLNPTDFDVTVEKSSATRPTPVEQGKSVLSLDIFPQKAGEKVRLFSHVEWKSDLDMEVLQSSQAIDIRLIFDGVAVKLTLYFENVQQSDDDVKVMNPYVG